MGNRRGREGAPAKCVTPEGGACSLLSPTGATGQSDERSRADACGDRRRSNNNLFLFLRRKRVDLLNSSLALIHFLLFGCWLFT